MKNLLITTCVFLCCTVFSGVVSAAESNRFVLASPSVQAAVFVAGTEPECVQLAVQDFISDVKKITGIELKKTSSIPKDGSVLIVGTASVKESVSALQSVSFHIPENFTAKWECFRIEKLNSAQLVICGSEERGTMFGIYDFLEKQLGVDPLYFWNDNEPAKRTEIAFDSLSVSSKEPSYHYRGWFINDEDILSEWKESGSKRNIDYMFYHQVVHPDIMEQVVEALVRNKFNLIIPASFLDIMNPPEEKLIQIAAKRGVFISQHHIEPLGVSGFSFFNYWKAKDGSKPLFSFYSNKDKLLEVWDYYAQRWAKYPNVIWQIGLRGVGDRPMWLADPGVPQSDADRGKIISDAVAVQQKIIQKYDSRKEPPMTMTLWAEGSELYHRHHIKIPENTVIVFSDNSPGWRWQNDFYSIPRQDGKQYGVYYHHQLWSSGPHLAQGVSPLWTWTVFKETQTYRATDYAVLNVSNIREFVFELAASSQFLYDFDCFVPDKFMENWFTAHYPSKPKEVQKLYQDYFDSFVVAPQNQSLLLLDGLTRQRGLQLLKQIGQYVTDKSAFSKNRMTFSTVPFEGITSQPKEALRPSFVQQEENNNKSLIDMGLSSAYPTIGAADTILFLAQAQRKAFEKVAADAEAVLPSLTEKERQFLKTNFIAHNDTMIALTGWYENLILAKTLLMLRQEDTALEYLRRAEQYLSKTDSVRQMLTQGEKWQYWYRGEKKMNIAEIQAKTKETVKLFSR